MSTKRAVILHNAVKAKLHEPDRDLRRAVSDILSYKVDGADYSSASQSWDGYSSFYAMRTNSFPAGFVRLVSKRLERLGYKVLVKAAAAPEPLGPENPTVDAFPEDPRYDYQAETMRRLVTLKRLVACVATGGGKSRVFKLCAERIGRTTLFLTTRKSLMYQMANTYQNDLGKGVGILGDGAWTPRTGVNFATVDTLAARLRPVSFDQELEKEVEKHLDGVEEKITAHLKKLDLPTDLKVVKTVPEALKRKVELVRQKYNERFPIDHKGIEKRIRARLSKHGARRQEALDFLATIEFLCVEEAHEVGSDGFYMIANACTKAHYRLALTATPFMKDSEESNMRLMAATGSIGIKVSEKLLIDRGILATPYFKYIDGPRPTRLQRGTPWQRAYTLGITENVARNAAIVDECIAARRYGLPIMILVQHTKHGKALVSQLESRMRVKFIHGAHEQEQRQAALTELGNGGIDVLIGSTILDVGVDVPAVGLVILAGGGKAEVALRQRIGRGLRAKKIGPNLAFILDFTDSHNNHLAKHARERRRIVDETPGFAANVVRHFDYEALGFSALKAAI